MFIICSKISVKYLIFIIYNIYIRFKGLGGIARMVECLQSDPRVIGYRRPVIRTAFSGRNLCFTLLLPWLLTLSSHY